MTPIQLKKLLARSGFSQSEAARRLDITDRTMRRYIAGELLIPTVVELALRYLELHEVDDDSLTDEEKMVISDARQEVRAARPGTRPMIVKAFRNAVGELAEVRFVWEDSPGRLLAGRAFKLRNGEWQTDVR